MQNIKEESMDTDIYYFSGTGNCLYVAKEIAKTELNFKELIPLTDRSIELNENCIGCGICVKICPVDNIELINKKPVWKNHCEMCFACDEWCPQNAILHWSRKNRKKYHHPHTTIEDFITARG